VILRRSGRKSHEGARIAWVQYQAQDTQGLLIETLIP
jgi:hypothetical protein